MQDTPTDFRALIDRWDSPATFARLVAGPAHSSKGKIWRRRNRVPVEYHPAVVTVARIAQIPGITLESLAAMRKSARGVGY